jgi:hypothetical protein
LPEEGIFILKKETADSETGFVLKRRKFTKQQGAKKTTLIIGFLT